MEFRSREHNHMTKKHKIRVPKAASTRIGGILKGLGDLVENSGTWARPASSYPEPGRSTGRARR